MGQIGQAAMAGYPLWYYGVKTEEELPVYLIHKHAIDDREVIRNFDNQESAMKQAKMYQYENARIIPRSIDT